MLKPEWNKKYTTIAAYTVIVLLVVALGVILLIGLITDGMLFQWVGSFMNLISPVIYGFIIAYLLNPIMKLCDRKVFAFLERKKPRRKLRRALSVTLTYLSALFVLTVFILMIIPQIVSSYEDLSSKMSVYIASAQKWADNAVQNFPLFGNNFANFSDFFDKANISTYLQNLISDSGNIFETIVTYVLSYTGKFVVELKNALFGFILSIYFLLSKEKLIAQMKKILSAVFSRSGARTIVRGARLTNRTFGGFITGKILDSIIVSLLIFVVLGIFDIPFYPLVALIIGVTDIIPVIGPFIGAIPSAFIIFIADPIKALWFIVIVIVIQQIDGNLIAPKILGETTGLSSMWVIIAIIIAGGVSGFAGMFLGVPLFAVLYTWIKSITERRLRKKRLPADTTSYYPGGSGTFFFEDSAPAGCGEPVTKDLPVTKDISVATDMASAEDIPVIKDVFAAQNIPATEEIPATKDMSAAPGSDSAGDGTQNLDVQ